MRLWQLCGPQQVARPPADRISMLGRVNTFSGVGFKRMRNDKIASEIGREREMRFRPYSLVYI